ncbi:hypothetical protein CHCC20335_3030 [Bacillus paralicheniformis]|nr:hypothetical protein CHCC20335_3030 [Bacillus paralicheniformis]
MWHHLSWDFNNTDLMCTKMIAGPSFMKSGIEKDKALPL